MLEPMHSLVTNCCVVDACVQVRAESPMEHSAQGKRSDTLGLPMLEQSRPERAKALKRALDFYKTAIINIAISPTRDASPPLVLALCACIVCLRCVLELRGCVGR